jgi:hypothetical protein
MLQKTQSVFIWAYFRNGPNAAASIAPTLIRPWRRARWGLMKRPPWLKIRSTGAGVTGIHITFSSNGCRTIKRIACAKVDHGSSAWWAWTIVGQGVYQYMPRRRKSLIAWWPVHRQLDLCQRICHMMQRDSAVSAIVFTRPNPIYNCMVNSAVDNRLLNRLFLST